MTKLDIIIQAYKEAAAITAECTAFLKRNTENFRRLPDTVAANRGTGKEIRHE